MRSTGLPGDGTAELVGKRNGRLAGHTTAAEAGSARPSTGEPGSLPPFARRPVLAIAAAVGLVLLLTSPFRSYAADELWFYAAGKDLQWGYADQPPLVPLLARAMDTLFPGSLTAFRLPSTLVTAAGVVVTALLARELGGGRRAQVLAAGAWATSYQAFVAGSMLATYTIDAFLWTVVALLLVRWVRLYHEGRRDDWPLLWAGVATAAALQAKFLIVGLWPVLVISVVVAGPRALLRRPALWAGGVIALLVTAPTLRWQAEHGWPQIDMAGAISQEASPLAGRLVLLPMMIGIAGILVGAVLFCYGGWRLLRSPDLRPYRFLGWTVVGVAALFLLARGHTYYIAGLYAPCWAAAAVEMQRRRPARWWCWVPTWPVYALSAALTLTATMIIAVISGMGWPQLADTVSGAYRALPPEQRQNAVIVTSSYADAGAIERFGVRQGLPHPYSGSRGYWHLGRPPDESRVMLFVGPDPGHLRTYFTEVREVARTGDHSLGIDNGALNKPIWLCTGQRAPWSQLWPEFLHFD